MQIKQPKAISAAEKFSWIQLSRSENIGPATFFRLIEIFGSAKEAINQTPTFSAQDNLRKPLKLAHKSVIESEIEKTQKFGGEIIIFLENDYPRLLREIYDPAPVLTIKGRKELVNQDTIAIVGPRNATFHACKFAEKLAYDLAQSQIVIASGLARGIDAAAHRGSIISGTIAVIAGGINHIYPQENKDLYDQISRQGLLISEQPFDGVPRGSNFIQRNRIISGISYGVVVVEASLQSGSLATSRFAAEQGRDVFAIPGFPGDPRNSGSNLLLEEGAIFTQNAMRILREMPGYRNRFSESGKLSEPEVEAFEAPTPRLPSEVDIKKAREEIFTKIGFIPITIEEIASDLQIPARLVNIALVQLELADKIEINFGKVIKK